jgi:hypothetical protein
MTTDHPDPVAATGLTAGVAMDGSSLSSLIVGFFRERMNAARVDPAIVKIEQRADGDGEIDRLVIPSQCAERLHIFGGDSRRIMVYFIDKSK